MLETIDAHLYIQETALQFEKYCTHFKVFIIYVYNCLFEFKLCLWSRSRSILSGIGVTSQSTPTNFYYFN